MADVVFGIFTDKTDADDAIEELQAAGFNPKDISIMTKEITNGNTVAVTDSQGDDVAAGTLSGATTGGVIGAAAGLLVGIGAIAIPGLGALLIGGPLAVALGLTGAAAATVSGAATGALAGGLLGALVSLGVPEEDAQVYQDRINEGAMLIAVPTSEKVKADAREILEDNGADRVRSIHIENTAFRGVHV